MVRFLTLQHSNRPWQQCGRDNAGTQVLHASRDFLLTSLIAAGIVSFVTIPLAGHLSDLIGRKRMYLIGAVTTGIFGFIYFAMLDTTVPILMFLAIVLSFVPHDLMY